MLDLQVDPEAIIPRQRLKGNVVAYVAKITHIQPISVEGERLQLIPEDAPAVGIAMSGRSCRGAGTAIGTFSAKEYRRIKRAYDVRCSQDLLGKPVISLYDQSRLFIGLIPLRMDE